MDYLYENTIPSSPEVYERVRRLALWIKVGAMGDLFALNRDGRQREIPLVGERVKLMTSAHRDLCYPSGIRLYQHLKMRYYWPGMKRECEETARRALANQMERAKPEVPKYLFPCSKGHRPFAEWSIDCIVGLLPPDEEGCTVCVVAVDVFTKWVEVSPLKDLSSGRMAKWIHNHIVNRFGLPTVMRFDRGKEFMGEVLAYCDAANIHPRRISTANSRA